MLNSDKVTFNRRTFCNYLLIGTTSLIIRDFLSPSQAKADNFSDYTNKYHVFIPYNIAQKGGVRTIVLRSGNSIFVKIPAPIYENKEILCQVNEQDSNYINLVFHTFYDPDQPPQKALIPKIYDEIEHHTSFINKTSSQVQCKRVLEEIQNGKPVSDLTVLELLDYIVSSSKLNDSIKQRYLIGSNNSRLLEIENTIADALRKSKLSEQEKQEMKATFQYVRAQEVIPNLKYLYDLDTIIGASSLSTSIKHYYFVASSTSRALTVDAIIIQYLTDNPSLTTNQKISYLEIYTKVRSGQEINKDEQNSFRSLDFLIKTSKLPESVKFIYKAASSANDQETKDKLKNDEMLQAVLDAFNNGGEVPATVQLTLNLIGAETATGVSISSLTGGAATNAMLVFLGGGSVAAGGLGMLGGLAVITGGAALVGAAGLLPLLFISKLDKEDLTHLGISFTGGAITGATGVFAAWTIAGTLGVAESLSGAAAISATIAALGGVSVMTGGAALVASGVTFLIWSFLQSHKTRNGNALRELETRSYTLAEFSSLENLEKFISDHIQNGYHDGYKEYFSAPLIPLDKLANALSSWASLQVNEKILGLIDTSIWDDAKEGVIFTGQRIIWKSTFSSHFISYQELTKIFSIPVYQLTKEQHDQLSSLQGVLGDSNEYIKKFLLDITQEYSRLNLA